MGLESLLGVLPGVMGGLFGDNGARKRAEYQRKLDLQSLEDSYNNLYANLVAGGQHDLFQAAGLGADAIHNLGTGLGDTLAASGVYNSSAVGGTLANAQHSEMATLADMATQNQRAALNVKGQGLQALSQARLGIDNQNVDRAYSDEQQQRAGTANLLYSLGQVLMPPQKAAAPKVANVGSGNSFDNGFGMYGPTMAELNQGNLQMTGTNNMQTKLPMIYGQQNKGMGLADRVIYPRQNSLRPLGAY